MTVTEWERDGRGREGGRRQRLRKPLCDGLKLSFIACQGCAQWAAELMLYDGEWSVGVRRDNKKKQKKEVTIWWLLINSPTL